VCALFRCSGDPICRAFTVVALDLTLTVRFAAGAHRRARAFKAEPGAHVVHGAAWAGWARHAGDRASHVSRIAMVQGIKRKTVLHGGSQALLKYNRVKHYFSST
jgi:hypothetical protein